MLCVDSGPVVTRDVLVQEKLINKLKWIELGTRKRSSKLEMMDWIQIKSKGKDQRQIKQTCLTVSIESSFNTIFDENR